MQRLIFANQLRGVAALAVVASHLMGVFWGAPAVVGAAIAAPPVGGPPPWEFGLVSFPGFNFGPFGVGLFFLISGLVIPYSLGRHSRGSFLAARALRIYPTFVVALCLEFAVVQANALHWGLPMPFSRAAMLSNLTLTQWLAGYPSLDLVNWTLVIELKFYVLMAIGAPLLRRGSLGLLFGLAALMLLGNLALQVPPLSLVAARYVGATAQLSNDSIYLVFMLIGVMFSYHVRGLIGLRGLVLGVAGLLALYRGVWAVGLIRDQFPLIFANDMYALLAFALVYAGRRWARPTPVLDFFAAISFPLYLIHSLIGYSVLNLLMLRLGVGYGPALIVAFLTVVALATLLHRTVEQASIRLGHRCAPRPALPAGAVVV